MDTYKGYTLVVATPKPGQKLICVQVKIERPGLKGPEYELITGFTYPKNSIYGPGDAKARARAWIDKNPVENFAPIKH